MENEKRIATSNAEMVTISRAEYESQQTQLTELKLQNQWLLEQLGLAKKRQFGSSSEKLQEGLMDQLSLSFNELEAYAYGTKSATPEQVADRKIKREKTGDMSLHLKPTRDIAAHLGEMKKQHPGKVLVGFALETNDEQHNAEDKLNRKNLDFIVLNSLNDKGAGFRYDTNKISIIDRNGKKDYPLKSKAEVAADIVDHLAEVMKRE
jgi:hypothetical protein